MKGIIMLIALLLLAFSAAGENPEPFLKSAPMPFYPRLAGQARIGGKVTVRFTVNEQGETSDVRAITGHPILRDAAIQNVQNWKFAWVHPCACSVKEEVVFFYSVSGDWIWDNGPTAVVKWFGKSPVTRVEIQVGGTLVEP